MLRRHTGFKVSEVILLVVPLPILDGDSDLNRMGIPETVRLPVLPDVNGDVLLTVLTCCDVLLRDVRKADTSIKIL